MSSTGSSPSDDSTGRPPGKKKRSRLGCRNCKLRGVKCDESKPKCQRCVQYGVVCSYAAKSPNDDLHHSSEQEFVIRLDNPKKKTNSEIQRVKFVPVYLDVPSYIPYWSSKTDELLNKFQLLTAMTISVGPRTRLYASTLVDKARSYPFMLHGLLGLTSIHFRAVTTGTNAIPSPQEAEHCYKAVSLFVKEFRHPRTPEHQAIILFASSLLFHMTFANVEAKVPEEAWPLAPPSPSDLGWLKMACAKRELELLKSPLGSDPLFSALSGSFPPEITFAKSTPDEPAVLPLGFISLFGLESTSNATTNPYFTAASQFARIVGSDDTIVVSLGFVLMISEISDQLRSLIFQKEPKALLLLACFFAKMSRMPTWWFRPRAIMEGQAICKYLDMYHADNFAVQVLLRWPKSMYKQLGSWDVYPMSLRAWATDPRFAVARSGTSPRIMQTSCADIESFEVDYPLSIIRSNS